MLHKLTNKNLKGFTLIELLVVIAIIGLLSTVIAAPITEARKKGRDSKKISDLRSIYTAINIYADDHGGDYPDTLSDLVSQYIPNLPTNAATGAIGRDKYMYVAYSDSNLAGRTVGYHLGVKLESANQALNDDADCGGVSTALSGSTKSCIGAVDSAVPYTTTGTITISNSNYAPSGAGTPPAAAANADFGGGADTGTTTCTQALNTCVYDITN